MDLPCIAGSNSDPTTRHITKLHVVGNVPEDLLAGSSLYGNSRLGGIWCERNPTGATPFNNEGELTKWVMLNL